MKIFELHDPLFLPHCGCELQFSVNSGSSIVFIGENGIGKSTLLRHLYSALEMESRVVVEQKSSEYFFDRKLITLKNFFLEGHLPHFNIKNFLSLWNDFELDKKEQRLISHLSGGETQALKLCLALCKDCTFYFLDEPSQFLDTQRKKTLSHFLEKLRQSGKSLIVIEHNIDWIPSGWKINQLKVENNVLQRGAEWII
jgi:ABC-type Mn2+/Zn2+ transport system ATPase subunit